jgi:hypothetical protein
VGVAPPPGAATQKFAELFIPSCFQEANTRQGNQRKILLDAGFSIEEWLWRLPATLRDFVPQHKWLG